MPGNDRAGLDREPLRERLETIVREAGELALAAWKRPLKRWTKAGASPVSEADIAVNDFLATRLPALAPDAGWLSEETEDDLARTESGALWVVDPIDGTRAYLDGRADWSVSVALVEDGRPSLAALYAPATNEMYLAARGRGATLNAARLQVNTGDALNGARLAGPKSFLNNLTQINPRLLLQPKIHSLALRFAKVAEGTLDAAFASRNSSDWDLAAADLLVHEAGGALTDLNGRVPRYNQAQPVHGALVAAGLPRHSVLLDLVREHRSEFA
ncbi:MAG: 3'(2'),5'-bisphosphate nucleotidase CysQ [Pseudolabrys sp.]